MYIKLNAIHILGEVLVDRIQVHGHQTGHVEDLQVEHFYDSLVHFKLQVTGHSAMLVSRAMPVISAFGISALVISACFGDLGLLGGDLGLVSSDLGLVLRYINKSVCAFEIIIVVVCTYCSVSMVAVKNCVYALEINIVV